MGMFLNSIGIYDRYQTVTKGQYFVDKTALLEEIIPLLGQEQRFLCITRPRRFGKTIMANMIGSFFEKGIENRKIFDSLAISKSEQYEEYIGKYNVIYVDFSEIPEDCKDYHSYIKRISDGIKRDLQDAFSTIDLQGTISIWDMLSSVFEKTGEKFIFIMDEWDAPFHMEFISEDDRKSYLLFLKLLLKGKSYIELAYMTGILPIAKYSSGSELNMFLEYDMATKIKYSEYFGFSDEEVDVLYDRYRKYSRKPRITREELREWYDGYYTAARERIYNPRSIVCALSDNQLSNYWTSSGPYDEIFYYVRNDIKNMRNDLALMVIGEKIHAKIGDFAAVSMELKTKNQIYSAMVIYGLLTYDNGQVFIPNKELMLKYEELLQREDSLGYVYRLAKKSDEMLQATLAGDVDTMSSILEYAHDTETPILSYNAEIELTAIVNLVYLSARDRYMVEREDKAGKGFVDFIFYPMRKEEDGIILELKVNHSPEEAISQIKNKKYALKFQGKLAEQPKYTGRILAVGIGYDKQTKKHDCKVEVLHAVTAR